MRAYALFDVQASWSKRSSRPLGSSTLAPPRTSSPTSSRDSSVPIGTLIVTTYLLSGEDENSRLPACRPARARRHVVRSSRELAYTLPTHDRSSDSSNHRMPTRTTNPLPPAARNCRRPESRSSAQQH